MSDKKLAYTVHHKGRIFTAGMTADEIGPMAGELGDHCWEGGKAPAKSAIPGDSAPTGGLTLGSRIVPPPSGLPGNAQGEDPVLEVLQGPLGTISADQDPDSGIGGADTGSGAGDGDTAGESDPAKAEAGDGSNTAPRTAPAKKAAPKKSTAN